MRNLTLVELGEGLADLLDNRATSLEATQTGKLDGFGRLYVTNSKTIRRYQQRSNPTSLMDSTHCPSVNPRQTSRLDYSVRAIGEAERLHHLSLGFLSG